MRKRKEVKEQAHSQLTKKIKTDVTNQGEKRETIDKFFSAPSQVGFIYENIPLSQKPIGVTIPGYADIPAKRYCPSS
eukprot:11661965-Heterocapsa_arctica.AAC.1